MFLYFTTSYIPGLNWYLCIIIIILIAYSLQHMFNWEERQNVHILSRYVGVQFSSWYFLISCHWKYCHIQNCFLIFLKFSGAPSYLLRLFNSYRLMWHLDSIFKPTGTSITVMLHESQGVSYHQQIGHRSVEICQTWQNSNHLWCLALSV